ncbi:polysaccharide biosynthesis protein [Paenibacillus alkaliterrae]|uniref:polysaccharide biosynthesis protein n=1 Tax=Paenibacillus alkaliterrae TaxID=320909 RepID=UPI001F22B3D7|nr:polysaccharide biosynthesis protein [Paenibacillus alkaliterrae]MCF2940718.1 polysaccharide biosynthesis protein [Paenibacillus alkaliterrae]
MRQKPERERQAAALLEQANGERKAEAVQRAGSVQFMRGDADGTKEGDYKRDDWQRPGRLWLNGVVIMAGAALLSKVIGVFQKIPLQNLAGDRVFGIYNAVYPFYQLAAVLATAGLPTAVSLLIAERLRKGDNPEGVRRTLYAALLLLGVTGILAFGWMWASAEQVSRWIGDSETASAIRTVSVALLLVPFVAALRGYAQGLGRMPLSAASQITEQMIRVAVMLYVLAISGAAGWADASIAAGVMSGSAVGAIGALLILAAFSWRERRRGQLACIPGALRAEMKRLAAIALPVALGAVVVPVLGVVDAFTVPRLLRDGGLSESAAMAMFGIYSRAQPLVQLVVMVAGAAAAALVPGLALARMRGAYGQLRLQLTLAERAAWAIGAAASIGLVLLAEPINVMLYTDAKGTTVFALVGCTALAGSVNAVNAPVLQGIGSVRTPAVLLLIAALMKGVLNAMLVPLYGAEGAAVAGIAALSAVALLGTAALRRAAAASGATARRGGRRPAERESGRGGERGQVERRSESVDAKLGGRRPAERRRPALNRAAAGTGFALAFMAAALIIAERALSAALGGLLPPRAAAAALALTGVAVGACAFGAAALRSGAVSARELRALPGGGVLAARLRRWRLIPPADGEE